MCSSAPCKVLNGGSRDEVITVWAVAGHHYDLITHNITTKYNYHTFIISRTDLKYALCVMSLQNCIVGFCLHSVDMYLHLRGGPGPGSSPNYNRAQGWLLGPVLGVSTVSTVWTRPVYYVGPGPGPLVCLLQPAVPGSKHKRGINDNIVEKLQSSQQCNGLPCCGLDCGCMRLN